MKIRVEIENYDAKAKQFGAAFDAALTKAMEASGAEMTAFLMKASPVATGKFQSSWTARTTRGRGRVPELIVENTDPGALAVEFGRKPGKAPPPQQIAAWALAKGIIKEIPEMDEKGFADKGGPLSLRARVGRKRTKLVKEKVPRRFVSKRARGKIDGSNLSPAAVVFGICKIIKKNGITGKKILSNNRTGLARILRDNVVSAIRTFGLGKRVVSSKGS